VKRLKEGVVEGRKNWWYLVTIFLVPEAQEKVPSSTNDIWQLLINNPKAQAVFMEILIQVRKQTS
jgi:hypothetical protein